MILSRSFQHTLVALKASGLRKPISSRYISSQVKQELALTTWNIDATSLRPVARAKLLLNNIIEETKRPDVVFIQEVISDVCFNVLNSSKVRKAFIVVGAENPTTFEGVPFANVTLLSKRRFDFDMEPQTEQDYVERGTKFTLGPVSLIKLPSKYGRCALSVDIISPSGPTKSYRLVNVHLDSLWDTLPYRKQQMEILANLLREPGCGGGLIAGDFNAISPEDHTLLDKNGLVDAWLAVHRNEGQGGATWGVGGKRRDRLGKGRLDRLRCWV